MPKKHTQKELRALLHPAVQIFDEQYKGECNTEDGDLATAIGKARVRYPEHYWHIFHVANESNVPVQARMKLKNKGLLSGVSDIIIACPKGVYGMAAIEAKRRDRSKSKLSYEQVMFLNAQAEAGNFAALAYGAGMIALAISKYLQS